MVAPHVHTLEEARKAIKNVEGNTDDGPPMPKSGGSGKNFTSGTHEGIPVKTIGSTKGKRPETV